MAGTTADKLAKLAATKESIKSALQQKGQNVGDFFGAYPAAILAIPPGGNYFTTSFTSSGGPLEIKGLPFEPKLVVAWMETGPSWEEMIFAIWDEKSGKCVGFRRTNAVYVNVTSNLISEQDSTYTLLFLPTSGSGFEYGNWSVIAAANLS